MTGIDVAVAGTKADRVRLLAERHPYFTPRDIAKLTGFPLAEVRNALKRGPRGVVKSRRAP